MFSLIILRGLPGSGKSTLASVLAEGKWPVHCIDDYFTDPHTGEYKFNFSENHLAYRQCEENTEQDMREGVQKILIDNAFTLEWELEPYFAMAKRYNYKVFVATVENRHGNPNTHGITTQQLQKMAEKYRVVLF